MARNDGRIEPGQKLAGAISARAWNRAQDAADRVLGVGTGATAGGVTGGPQATNIVLVRNTTSAVVPMFGVLQISNVAFSPAGGTMDGTDAASSRAKQLAQQPVLLGIAPNFASADSLDLARAMPVIALEPVAANAIGRFAAGGVFMCKVKRVPGSRSWARMRQGDVTQLVTTSCGPVRLIWVESGEGDDKWAVGKM